MKETKSPEGIMRCFPVMAQLRPHLIKDEFVSLIQDMARDGYRLAYLEHDNEIVGVVGFRITTTLFMGKNLYVDDLVTDSSHRSQGFGATMLSWLRQLAIDNDCTHFHLDSGTQRQRAHKFYFTQGMTITTFHFTEKLATD